ncbi:GAF domain-containing protein [Paralcaligenes ureilyticus]|uniref:GAF domain-containing protein n=2 Tax=Paralcaligenes ureilyticus TaxID=627131 RepID=A0A4R3M628_9BURK|nr:GAF domain-containing protein [Paralcaligenes ureilyticus]
MMPSQQTPTVNNMQSPENFICIKAKSFNDEAPLELFAAADACAFPVLRHSQCTINRFDAQKMQLTRLYSSDTKKYPIGGTKSKSDTGWGRHVLLDKRLFVGEGTAAIKKSFDDHELIIALGLRSVINVPLVSKDTCLGTLNFLSRVEHVTQTQITFAQLLGLLITPTVQAFQGLKPT